MGGVLGERSDRCAAQRSEVGEAAEGAAEVGGEDADIGAAGAGHLDGRPRRRTALVLEAEQVERVDRDRAGGAVHGLAAASLGVEALATELDRRHHWRDLELGSDQPGQCRCHALPVDLAGWRGRGHGAVGVEGVGFCPERDRRQVAPGLGRKERQQAGGAAERDDQHTGGWRVERAAVPDSALAGDPANAGDHVVGGHPRWLVADKHAVQGHSHPTYAAWRAATIRWMVASTPNSEVKPAARAWPPPPSAAARRPTLAPPLERSDTLNAPSGCSLSTAATSETPSVRTRSINPSVCSMSMP